MSLRSRLLAGLVVMVLALAAAAVAVGASYRGSLIDQLDERLALYRERVPGLLARAGISAADGSAESRTGRPFGGPPVAVDGAGLPGGPPGGLSDVYLGVVGTHGVVRTVLSPTNDPDLQPVLPVDLAGIDGAFTARNAGDSAERVRVVVVTAEGSGEPIGVVALSMADVERSFARLRATALIVAAIVAVVLAVVSGWIVRLGLRPLTRMTAVADAITQGRRDVRAPEFPAATEAARLSEALNSMIDENQRSEARLRRFVADASHELRTPLTTLRGYTALYSAGGLPDDRAVADAMGRIGSEATRMGTLVDDLLLLADLDEERPLQLGEVDLARVLADVAADTRVIQPERSITVDVPTDQGALTVVGDEGRLAQAIGALVANAARHTPIEAHVIVRGTNSGGRVRIVVADDGPGIPPEHLPHVFERFYRADPSRSRAGGGSGLGLSIVQAIIEAHGGTAAVASETGHGTTFTLELPTGSSVY